MSSMIREFQGELAAANRRIDELETTNAAMDDDLAEARRDLDTMQSQRDEDSRRADELQTAVDDIRRILERV